MKADVLSRMRHLVVRLTAKPASGQPLERYTTVAVDIGPLV